MSNQSYEYAVKNIPDHRPTVLRDELNKYAKKGWKLHEIAEVEDGNYYIFERPVE